jgi:hypothetical protein
MTPIGDITHFSLWDLGAAIQPQIDAGRGSALPGRLSHGATLKSPCGDGGADFR